ncbi:MAG: IS66 family transposase [Longimicrobiales bacterium]|nr:IS66 family transposase [Longimicrobiales bacterium]
MEEEVRVLRAENRTLKARLQRAERRAEAAERAGKRQAAPFSKGSPKKSPKRPGRRPGADYGVHARRRVPEHVDETVEVALPDVCPDCGGAVEARGVSDQYQTDIPPIRPHVTHFRIHLGTCAACGKAVRGRHPRQTSDALGAAASQLGPQAVALAAHLNKGLGLSFEKCTVLFHTAFHVEVSRSGLSQALDRLAAAAGPTYQGLVRSVREAPVVSPDETGWKVGGELQWLWVFATPHLTVYAIQDGRGFEQAARVLGPDYDGVLIRDGWAPYRRFEEARHQSCLAHLLRRCRLLIDDAVAGAARFPHAVRRLLLQGLELRHRYLAEQISPHGLAVLTGKLEAEMGRLLQWNAHVPANRRFLKHLTTEQPYLFTFLHNLDVEATNWWAEQAIRPAVVTRKVTGGNRTWAGALTQEVLASVLATSRKQGLSPYDLLRKIYCSPEPLIIDFKPPLPPPQLQPP